MDTVLPQRRDIMSIAEAAAYLGISQSTMYQIVRIKGFPCMRIGRRILVNRRMLDAWIDEMTAKGWWI